MSQPEWKDLSCYSQTSIPREADARTWALDLPEDTPVMRLVVTRRFPLDDGWFFRCQRLNLGVQLESKEIEAAKKEALLVTFKLVEIMFKELRSALGNE